MAVLLAKGKRIVLSVFVILALFHFNCFASNPALENLSDNTAIDLGLLNQYCTSVGGDPCQTISDYSGTVYDPVNDEVLIFGGGHSAVMTDTIMAFSFDTLEWVELYAPTPCSTYMVESNYDNTKQSWESGPSGSYPRPVSRHTYNTNVFVPTTQEFLVTTRASGSTVNCPDPSWPFTGNGRMAHYSRVTNEWTFSSEETFNQGIYTRPGVAWHPPSSKIVAFGTRYVDTYDPVTKAKSTLLDMYNFGVSSGEISDGVNLIYASDSDKFYIFMGSSEVYEITLDMDTPANSVFTKHTTTGTRSPSLSALDYDSVNNIIGGGISEGKFYYFDPSDKSWSNVTIQGDTVQDVEYSCLTYSPDENVFLFIGGDYLNRKTYVYRFAAENPPIADCSDGYMIDRDCDGYGVGFEYVTGPDADDTDPTVNTAESVITKYGTLQNFFQTAKGYTANNVYFLSLAGNDANPCSEAEPCLSQSRLNEVSSPGDVQVWMEGNYTYDISGPGPYHQVIPKSGTEEAEIVSTGYPGKPVTLSTTNIAIKAESKEYITVENFVIHNSSNPGFGSGMVINTVDNIIIKGCEAYDFYYLNVHHNLTNLTFDNNVIRDQKEHGIYFGAANVSGINENITVKNNLFYNNGEAGYPGLQHNGRVVNMIIEDNIFHSNGQSGISLLMGVSDSYIRRNLIYNNYGGIVFWIYEGSESITPYWQNNNIIEDNIIWVGKYSWETPPCPTLSPTGGYHPVGSNAVVFALQSGMDPVVHNHDGNIVRNNIIRSEEGKNISFQHWMDTIEFYGNTMWRQDGESQIAYGDGSSYTVAEMEAQSSLIHDNVLGEPDYADVDLSYACTPELFDFTIEDEEPPLEPPSNIRILSAGNEP